MIASRPLNIRQDKNLPRDNRDEGLLVWHPMERQQGESTNNHWKAKAVLKGGDDTMVRNGGWCVRDLEVGANSTTISL